jgi:hypothetical protein
MKELKAFMAGIVTATKTLSVRELELKKTI